MSHRPDLNTLGAADRQALVDLMLQYITDTVVDDHPLINHSGVHIFTGHRAYIAEMESWLSANGGAQFVPLPAWNPVNEIPPEFRVVEQSPGRNRPPLQNTAADPSRAMPSAFASPCGFATATVLGDAVNVPWHGDVHG